jgi:hypothetical protein
MPATWMSGAVCILAHRDFLSNSLPSVSRSITVGWLINLEQTPLLEIF